MGVQKLGHCCALRLWKGSGREPREDKEGIRIRVERPDCLRTAWKAIFIKMRQNEVSICKILKFRMVCYPS